MKISILLIPDSDQDRAVTTLMQRALFKEIERKVIVVDQKSIKVALTYEGNKQDFDMLSNSIYVKIKDKGGFEFFYSLEELVGFCGTIDSFLKHLKAKKKAVIPIQYFKQ